MSKLFAGLVWLGVWVCLTASVRAQPSPPAEAAQAAAGMARGIAAGMLAPMGATGTPPGAPAEAASGPMVVPMPRVTTPVAAGTSASGGAAAPAPRLPVRPVRTQGLSLEAGTGRIVSLDSPAASVFAADPHVAEVRPASPTSLFVLGIGAGRTSIAAIDDSGVPIAQFDVFVQPSSYAGIQAESAIKRQLPGRDIHVATRPTGLVVSGSLSSAAEAEQAMQTARDYAGAGQTVESRLSVQGSVQVNLRVRIAEVSRSVIRQLGINWSGLANLGRYAQIGIATANPLANSTVAASTLGGAYAFNTPGHVADLNAMIDAMAQDQLVHVLAEPNLTAISGETASFLVGGEFPIPVAQQNNQVTIEFKQYGVSLAFVPTVISEARINMKVRPEVSALSTEGAVQIGAGNSTIQVPALTVRRAETTVELASGQSFAIAGLLQDSTTLTGNALPGIGELPILGALFRSDSFQRNETELVIVITPYLVNGVSNPAQISLPTDNWKPPNDLERLLLLRQNARGQGVAATAAHIPGDAGFVVQ
jgi:pilus assembly protein CpaC